MDYIILQQGKFLTEISRSTVEEASMQKSVVIIGTLDTKGSEFAFVKELIEKQGLKALVVDFGVMAPPSFKPDVDREEVARAGQGDLNKLAAGDHKDQAMKAMADGLAVVVRNLYDAGRLDGIIGMGGTGGTSIATKAMRTLPVGVPKVMVSTVGLCRHQRYYFHTVHCGCGWHQPDQSSNLCQSGRSNCWHGKDRSPQGR